MQENQVKMQIKNFKIREGYLYKRSKYLQEWRKRWIVITINFIFTFQTKGSFKPTSIIDLKDVISVTSQLQNSQEATPNNFVINTKAQSYAFYLNDISEKWSWMVIIQRLMDYKQKGASNYNSLDQITTRGFESIEEYLFKKQINVINKSYSTLSFQQEERKKLMDSDQILRRLTEQKQILDKRQESLKKRQLKENKLKQLNSLLQQQIKKMNDHISDLQSQIDNLRNQRDEYKIIHQEFYQAVQKVTNRWSKTCNKNANPEIILLTVQILNILSRKNKIASPFESFQKTDMMSTFNVSSFTEMSTMNINNLTEQTNRYEDSKKIEDKNLSSIFQNSI